MHWDNQLWKERKRTNRRSDFGNVEGHDYKNKDGIGDREEE